MLLGPTPHRDLSADLVDEITLGQPLPGQTVTFTVGTQSTTAVTNAQGVAAGSIKLKQKPGTYEVTAPWPGIDGRYLADASAGVFEAQHPVTRDRSAAAPLRGRRLVVSLRLLDELRIVLVGASQHPCRARRPGLTGAGWNRGVIDG